MAKGRQTAAWEVRRHNDVLRLFCLLLPQWVFLASTIALLRIFSGGFPEHNFRKLGIEGVCLLPFTRKTFEHELSYHAVAKPPKNCCVFPDASFLQALAFTSSVGGPVNS